MLGIVAAVVAFTGFAALLLVWAEQDYAQHRTLTWRSAIASWLLYFFHANTVATAAFSDFGRLDALRTPLLLLGAAVGSVGFVIFVAAVMALVRRGGFDGLRATRLVTDGVFAWNRHPQNLGWALILLGFAVGSGSWIALMLVALFAIFAHRYALLEEAHLADRFGDGYRAYRAAVPAGIRRPTERTAGHDGAT